MLIYDVHEVRMPRSAGRTRAAWWVNSIARSRRDLPRPSMGSSAFSLLSASSQLHSLILSEVANS